jgi:hypothetical protein
MIVWTWRVETKDGAPDGGPLLDVPEFPSQSDAETWLGEVWRDLVDAGAVSASLYEADRLVYGPMSLAE